MNYTLVPALIALEHENGLVESQIVKYNGYIENLGAQLYQMNFEELEKLLPYTLHSIRNNGEPFYSEFRSDMKHTSKVFESSDSYFYHWETQLYGTIPYAYMLSNGGTWVVKSNHTGIPRLQLLDIALEELDFHI